MEDFRNKTLEEVRKAKRVIKNRTLSYIAGGLGFVAGLAWNDAIRFLIESILPNKGDSIAAKLFYALFITVVVGLVIYYVERSMEKDL